MSVTEAVPASTTTSTPSATDRKGAAAAAALFGGALFVTVAAVNVPYKAADAELLAWWQVSGNRTAGLVSGLAAVCAAVLLPVVLNHLQGLRAAAAAPRWLAFARSMGAAVTAVWLVTGAARATVGHLVDVMDEPLPGLDVLRFATALNYTLLGVSGMAVIGLCALAVSVLVLRTGVLARWVGYVGAVGGAVIMLAVVAQLGAFATPFAVVWALALAVGIWRQPTDLGRPLGSG